MKQQHHLSEQPCGDLRAKQSPAFNHCSELPAVPHHKHLKALCCPYGHRAEGSPMSPSCPTVMCNSRSCYLPQPEFWATCSGLIASREHILLGEAFSNCCPKGITEGSYSF